MEKEVEEYYGKGSWSNIVIDKLSWYHSRNLYKLKNKFGRGKGGGLMGICICTDSGDYFQKRAMT